ncbi:DMT family transporter [Gordonia shandongensis]|uniref:DMT family transporter n=1 Tax=Gordonia shandongensis TaxID=376351 RepID=UPI0003F5EECE|nr:DMT family transporter [Gordonia shandongensis]
MHTWAPILLAISAAVLIAAGTVVRQRASCANGAITAGWWLGAGVALSGFVLQAVALGLGSILVVQPLVVLAVLFAIPMEAWLDRRRLARVEVVWGTVLVACVAAFLVLARPVASDRRPNMLIMICTVGGLIAGLVALVVLAERVRSAHFRALCYGLAAGALFGVSALLVKAVSLRVVHDPMSTFGRTDLYLLIVVAVFAVVAQQRGFGAGDLQTSFPAMNVMEPTVAMLLGVLLLGENVYVGAPSATFLVIVAALAAVAVVKLAKDAAVRGRPPIPDEEQVPVGDD